eukprot:TRINITY_DN725_c0_g2_i1.p1 TRINITY_DN725_c0_g2~~TRINITY_DN725_c0_g2_i1.p1  ORF type:complete len:244 (-),score=83.67 TRINITY_DN725_c0_g2_i1:78-731(-)
MSIGKYYLLAYNGAQASGWGYILTLVILHYFNGRKENEIWPVVQQLLIYFQFAAVLEVLHSLVGLVKTSAFTTFMQVLSRFVVTIVCILIPISNQHIAFTTMILAWSITEFIRYNFYTCSINGKVPHFLLWLRYSSFLILYPIGVASELIVCFYALPEIERTRLWAIDMPNSLNFAFSFHFFLIFFMLGYIPGFYILFTHMLFQRKRHLGATKQKTH